MTPPFAFLTGLLVVLATRELSPPVTGSGQVGVLAPYAALLVLPALLAAASYVVARRRLVTGHRGPVPPRALLRLSAVATPLVAYSVLGPGGWADLAARWAGSSHSAEIGLLLLPLFLAELPRLLWAVAAESSLEIIDSIEPGRTIAPWMLPSWTEVRPIVRLRFAWPLLILLPCAMLGIGLDLLQFDRRAHMFVLGTTPGTTLGSLAFLLVATMALPAWFRVAFGVVRELPEPVGTTLRRTAATLGFPDSRVLLLPTGNRAMNAMMVGPLPVGRFLCLTDGIVNTLDPESLAGVVAHEVGHAQKGHPLMLMSLAIGLPLLLPAAVGLLELPEIDAVAKVIAAVIGLVIAWSIVRSLAHRFEHEADASSVSALGAAPCTRALMVVSRLAMPNHPGVVRRLLSLHPEEGSRWEFMRRYEGEPAFRERFERRGRALRRSIGVALGLAGAAAALTWIVEWPFERAIWRLNVGDFRGARESVAAIGEVPDRWREPWERLRGELDVASAIAPEARDWPTARAAIEAVAWSRGLETLRREGPAAAAPWFDFASEVDDGPLCGAIRDFCRADDPQRREAARLVVRRLGVPPGLDTVFADPGQ